MKTNILSPKNIVPILLFFVALSTSSCEKKWKKTTKVDLHFEINKGSTSDKISFNSGYMTIHEINFSGKRKQGDDVNFTDEIDNGNGSRMDFTTGLSTPAISYDIPQGTYNTINMEFKINDEDTLSSYIVLTGNYINANSDTIPVRFEFESGEIFTVQGKAADGSSEIVLIEDQPATATVTFDPIYWVGLVTDNLLSNATLSTDSTTMVISEEENSDIYDAVAVRVSQSTKLTFK